MAYDVDLGRLQVHLRRLDRDDLLNFMDRALEALPADSLTSLIQSLPRWNLAALAPQPLLESVAEFHKASLAGQYYESFEVNYKNCHETSRGTDTWLAECGRLFAECMKASGPQARQGFESLFELLRMIDSGDRDIVFFGDEGGSYLLGVDWKELLGAYFCCLAATATAEQYTGLVMAVIEDFVAHDRERFLALAERTIGEDPGT
ncbi:hypothetical protein IV102_19725 [bacterium]|nr:hypothetical protein [bacterium]